jgi:hypothetical protein
MQGGSDENRHKATAGKRKLSDYRWGSEGPERRAVHRVRLLFALERAAAFSCSISENWFAAISCIRSMMVFCLTTPICISCMQHIVVEVEM